MQQYLIKRLLLFVPTLVAVSMTVFIIMRILPGDVAVRILAGPDGQNHYTQEEAHALRVKLGLTEPIPVQYLRWIRDLATMNFGESVIRSSPVASEALRRFLRVTLELAILSAMISLVVGIPSGVIQALKKGTIWDRVLRAISIGGLAMPAFWVGSLMVLLSVNVFGWFPPVGFVPIWKDPATNLQQMVLPALSLGYLLSAVLARMVRSTTLEVLSEDYVRTARAKGLSPFTVSTRHALRNALLPVVTITGVQLGGLLGGSVIVEKLFNLPGVGSATIDAVLDYDYPLVQFIVMVYALLFLVINLVVDLTYAVLDPRIRYG